MTANHHTAEKARDALYFDAPPDRGYLYQAQKSAKGSYDLWGDYRCWRAAADGTIPLILALDACVVDSRHFATAAAAIKSITISGPAKYRSNGERDMLKWSLAIKSPDDVATLKRIIAAVDAAIEAAAADQVAEKATAKAKADRERAAKLAQDKIISTYQRMTSARRRQPVSPRMATVLSATRNVTERMLRQVADGEIALPYDWDATATFKGAVKLALIDDPTGAPKPTPILDEAERVLDGVARTLTAEREEGSQNWWDAISNAAIPCRKTDPMPYSVLTPWERQFVQDVAQRRQKWEDGPQKYPFAVSKKQMEVLRRIYEKISHYAVV